MMNVPCRFLAVLIFATLATGVNAEEFVTFEGAACSDPPMLHCPDADCTIDRFINPGLVVEMQTRRTYFLDYPCDLKAGEEVTFILNLHGGGSYGNWMRHYFPLLDYANRYRLVVATPNSPIRVWTEVDDPYLKNIVESVVAQLGKKNVKSFWLAGHSQGGMTSNRLLRTDFFKDRVDGWISLSGGRLGGNPGRGGSFGPPPATAGNAREDQERSRRIRSMIGRTMALLSELPANDISFIYTTGEREMDKNGVPAKSDLATALGCGARTQSAPIQDSKAGYVYDMSRQNPPNPSWGLLPGPGTAEMFIYPDLLQLSWRKGFKDCACSA